MVRHRSLWILIVALIVLGAGLGAMLAQGPDTQDLKSRVEQRYEVLPVQAGIVLTPRIRSTVLSVEISGRTIAIDGTEVTGGEMRDRLGTDADLVLQLSYLSPAARRALFGFEKGPAAQGAPPIVPDFRAPPSPRRTVRAGAMVRFGGDAIIGRDETVDEDVVVIGGNARIDGEVNGDVVVIRGSANLGPQAHVHGDVTVVAGTLFRDPGAIIGGKVNEVAIGSRSQGLGAVFGDRRPFWNRTPFTGLAGTVLRAAALIFFGWMVMLVAHGPVTRIGERAAAEPLKAGFVGLLAETLFLPVLIITVALLAISIVGIPLLVLVPVAVLGLVVVFLMGFTGVAARIGQRVVLRLGWTGIGPYLSTVLGIGILLAPLLITRGMGLIGVNFVGLPILVLSVLIEYLAWTVGFGAAALTYLSPPPRLPAPPSTQPGEPPMSPEGAMA